jgi:chemotaxis regulatin CheY-phosphate phosphatase CheZ
MYERLGGIVRLLHDSMRELGYDRSLTDVAEQIGDAQSRLEHIATLTEQAANKVLNAWIRACLPRTACRNKPRTSTPAGPSSMPAS